MNIRFTFLKALVFILLIGGVSVFGQRQIEPAVFKLGKGFVSKTAIVNGISIHYVRGGMGSAVILIHGFPQDWSEFRRIMPRLAKKFTVIAVDLRGVGGSTPTSSGYEKANLAEDVHELAQRLKLENVYVAGHDIGGMVAYAFARRFPQETRGAMILDVPLPGIAPWEEVKANPTAWHFGFHQTAELPEELIAGRQFIYFRDGFFSRFALDKQAVSPADISRYAKSYGTAAKLRAGLEFYRAFPADERFNQSRQDATDVPFVLAGSSSMEKMNNFTAESLRKNGCRNVITEIIKNSGHYLSEEQPEITAELIERYASL